MALNDQPSLSKIHIDRNALTRGDWQSFAPHRQRVTELILGAADTQTRSLCVLGAGNANDLDLALLADRYEKFTLVDLDGAALEYCLAAQPPNIAARIETIAGVDLCGLIDWLDDFNDDSTDIRAAIERAQHPRVTHLAAYDVVVSSCVLTQMIDSAVRALGPTHPRLADLTLALRDGHLRLMSDLTVAGGAALLITDFVSSDTLPEVKGVPEAELENLLARAINERNFFTGVNPGVLVRQFGSIGGGIAELHRPWRWQVGDRVYGVYAVSMHSSGPKVHPFV